MKRVVILILLLLPMYVFCSGEKSETEKQAQPTVGNVPYVYLNKGLHSAIKTGGDFILKSAAELDSIWGKHYAEMDITPEPPEVDFTEDVVAAVFLPSTATSGFWINLDSVYYQGQQMIVQVSQNAKVAEGAPILQLKTEPYFFASFPKGAVPIKIVHIVKQ